MRKKNKLEIFSISGQTKFKRIKIYIFLTVEVKICEIKMFLAAMILFVTKASGD